MPDPSTSTLERPASGPAAGDSQPHGSGPRSGDDLISAAAKGETLDAQEQQDLLDYFLSNGELPGDSDEVSMEFEIGEGKTRRKNTWVVHRIGWDDWTDAQQRGTNQEEGTFDGFITASYVVARALVNPKLGPAVRRAQEQDSKTAPEDAADLLRRMFKKQSDALLSMSAEIRRISKLTSQQSARALDQEVAAGEA